MELYRLEIQASDQSDGFIGNDVVYVAHEDELQAISVAETFLTSINNAMKYTVTSFEAMPAGLAMYGRILVSSPKSHVSNPTLINQPSSLII